MAGRTREPGAESSRQTRSSETRFGGKNGGSSERAAELSSWSLKSLVNLSPTPEASGCEVGLGRRGVTLGVGFRSRDDRLLFGCSFRIRLVDVTRTVTGCKPRL